ncbi:hypothetical protein O181_024114 [Austropuccinia psidii MF-1]|uniref:Integrase catalytic domain-containing protein n=1 Tax=Austropuccinia psidii MF-1 TaxID=1389203 RepID=A0A9Q3CI09_9BASI|nr:hypothetical protein [Austropuccinia psidii MF-1]
MSGSTRLRNADDDDADAKPLLHEEVYSLLNCLRSEVSSLKSARNSDAAEMQSLCLALSPPPLALSLYPQNQRAVSSVYDQFMQELYRAADCSNHLLNDGFNFAEWVAGLNRVLCIVFDSELSVDNTPSLLENRSPQENRAILHFIDVTIPPDFSLCIGVIPACTSSKDFFDAIKARCCPRNCFQKLKVVRDLLGVLIENGAGQPQSNTTIILTLRRAFAMFKKLGVDADKLEGLLAQAACHAPPNVGQVAFDQLVTVAILAKGEEKPSSTFMGQVIMNALQRNLASSQRPSPFVYCVSDPLAPTMKPPCPRSPFFSKLADHPSNVRRPPDHLVNRFGGLCFHCGLTGHWRAGCPITRGFANPNPRPSSPGPSHLICQGTPELHLQAQPTSHYQQERLSQVKFVKRDAADRVLIDTGASIHLSGSHHFATSMQDIPPFHIFFADSNSSATILQTTTLKLPVKNRFVIIWNVPFSQEILGTILLVGRLCRAGVMPLFNGLSLSLLVLKVFVTTTFANDCWWLDVVPREETSWSAATPSSHCLLEMNLISLPTSVSLSPRGWHERLGHACNKFVISFLKQHVPSFDLKSWQSFYCEVCSKAKSTHCLARAHTDIPKQNPLDLLVSDIMGPIADDAQGFQYLLTIRDHVSTYRILYPLKSQSEAPEAVLDAVKQLQVHLGTTPKALRTDNAREFTSANFTSALASLGITFCPSLPYSPQESSKAERLNRMLGDMARAMTVQCGIPERFWQFAYSSAAFLHNRLPNSRCPNSSPHQELFGTAPSITTLYPFGADAIVHVPAVNQQHKLAPRGIECKLLKPLMLGSWLLWEPSTNRMVQSASVIFPHFQPTANSSGRISKGSLGHAVSIPDHLGRALSGPHRKKWREACLAELDQMAARDVWEAVEKKLGMKTIGHRQGPGVDCAETYAPTASLMSLRLLLATTALRGWRVASFDVSGAYLYSPVEETVLIEPPVDFLPELWGKALRLKKALYGMRQAGRCWWKFLSGILNKMGFIATEVDQSLYIFQNKEEVIAIWVHLDDGFIVSNSPDKIWDFKNVICAELDIKWMDKVQQIVGLECAIREGEVAIAQWRLTNSILNAYPRPVLRQDSPLPTLPVNNLLPDEATLDATPFQSVIGTLAYLGFRRKLPGSSLNGSHCNTLGAAEPCHWLGGDLERSQTGFMIKLGDAPILWGSKRQSVVALSTCAAEYIRLSDSTQHLVQAINQLSQLAGDFDKTIYCDNQAAVQVSIDNKSQKRMRYLDPAFFFVNDTIRKHGMKAIWVKTADMQADALTKRLSGLILLKSLPFLGIKG